MNDFNLRRNPQGAWEWEHDGQTYRTDPQGNGIWRKLAVPSPWIVNGQPRQYWNEWEMIVDRALFHMPADRTGAVNHLTMYYGA